MNSIDAQSLSRAYVQSTDATQSNSPRASKSHHHHQTHSQAADSVNLSDDAKSLSAARDAVQNTPDVRDQKVADIKQQISDGTYSVSSRVLARKMLDQQQP